MFEWIVDSIWTLLETLAGWILDVLLWVLEFVFELVNMFLDWIVGLGVGLVVGALGLISPSLPDNIRGVMADSYTWFMYVDDLFPLAFGLKLVVAYYSIRFGLNILKWILKAIPGIWG